MYEKVIFVIITASHYQEYFFKSKDLPETADKDRGLGKNSLPCFQWTTCNLSLEKSLERFKNIF